MKKSILLLMSMVFFMSVTVHAQKELSEKENKKLPEITFKKQTHDFGNIEFAGNGIYEFEFKNTGKEPLLLKNVRSSCGCTIPTWPKEPVKKNETQKISVKYDTKRVGTFTKTITVYSNAKNGNITLNIKGTVLPKSN